jgi:alanyl aminopeptidase
MLMLVPLKCSTGAVLALAAQAALAATSAPTFRLPDVAEPKQESLDITIVPDSAEFHGEARLEIVLKTSVSVLWLNAKDLSIRKVAVQHAGRAKKVATVVNGEFLGIQFEAPAGPGALEAAIQYSARLDDKTNSGLHRKKSGGDWYAYTTFTPIEARRAFPCFDEPRYKTNWRVTLHVPRADVALANSPAMEETNEPGAMKKVLFAETPPLAPSVVAFAVGPFETIEAGVAGAKRTPVRVIAPRGRGREAAAARTATAGILDSLESYVGRPYPWAKLDHLAVPDMSFGAVENPGLIMYREGVLLAAPERDTAERRRMMRATMAHELAHQWFGNLVTPAWWDDVWLSEGMATWLGGNIADLELPEFERGVAAAARRHRMLMMDSNGRTRAVRREMNSREDMQGVYSPVVYEKAAAILSMLEEWIGRAPFRTAMRRYVAAHANGNAALADFAAAIRTTTGRDPLPVLRSFLDRPHAPQLRASVRCESGAPSLVIEQTGPAWAVPVCWHDSAGRRACALIDGERSVQALDGCPAWLWPNAAGVGYYRSVPDLMTLEAVVLKGYSELSAAERVALAGDLVAATVNGSESAGDVLRLLPAIARDPAPAVGIHTGAILLELALAVPDADRGAYRDWLQQHFGIAPIAPEQARSIEQFLNSSR